MARQKVTKRRLLCKVASCTLGKSAPRFLRNLNHWERTKGGEFVVKRLKSLQSAALQARAGDFDKASQILREARVAVCREHPWIPRGIEGLIVRNIVEAKKPVVIRRNLMLTRSYTAFVRTSLSREQFNKAKKSITTPANPMYMKDVIMMYNNVLSSLPKIANNSKLGSLTELSGSSRYPSLDKLSSSDKKLPFVSLASSILTKGKVPQSLIDHFGDFSVRKIALVNQEQSSDETFGKISFLQEPGCKARVVCQPNGWLQYYFLPLHKDLMKIVNYVESVEKGFLKHGYGCSLDQVKGAWAMKRWMDQQLIVESIDLSSATDRYPRYLQTKILKVPQLNLQHYSVALEEVAKGPFSVNVTISGRKPANQLWSYEAGQPMGLYGSFPLFHLSHTLLLESISRTLDTPTRDMYCVLGDDVIISRPDLAKKYKQCIRSLGCDISETKSFEGKVAEFAGFLAISNGSTSVFRPFKWGNAATFDHKELHVLEAMGHEAQGLGHRWKKSLEIFQKTLPERDLDLTPLIHNEVCIGRFNKAGSRWFTAVLERSIKDDNPLYFHLKNTWKRESSVLIYDKAVALPLESDVFDPKAYLREERIDKKFNFLKLTDPLMARERRKEAYNMLTQLHTMTSVQVNRQEPSVVTPVRTR